MCGGMTARSAFCHCSHDPLDAWHAFTAIPQYLKTVNPKPSSNVLETPHNSSSYDHNAAELATSMTNMQTADGSCKCLLQPQKPKSVAMD